MLKEAKEAGAEVLLGDMKKAGPALLKPHVLTGVKTETRLWQRETFGPVLIVAVVDTVDEAVELANATDYSLAAAVWTNDLYNAMDVSRCLRSGLWFYLFHPLAPDSGRPDDSRRGCGRSYWLGVCCDPCPISPLAHSFPEVRAAMADSMSTTSPTNV